jgi:NAD(P)-dependent dehydrogenase (short-subunit alcohol dehydrogenase family)
MARTAIITGSDSGIGKATAITLARRGYAVGVTYRSDDAGAEETATEVRDAGGSAVLRQLDVTDTAHAPGIVDALADELGGLDVFVNNAGTGPDKPFLELDLDEWQKVIDTDLTGAFVCAQAAAKRMVAAGTRGRIINVTSIHEHVPLPGATAYCAAKGGLGLLTKVMALELAGHGITVNAVAPGETSTPMTGQHDADPAEQRRPGIPVGRPGDAYEIAEAVAFLASPEASYSTGSSVVVDGGLMLMAAVQGG